MKILFKALLTIDALLMLLTVYLVKVCLWIPQLGMYSIAVYILVPFLLAGACLLLSEKLSGDSIEGGITGIELANDSFLPSYIGYFFVALSIPDYQYTTLMLVFGVLFIFLLSSQNLYYNPLFLVMGYRFYYITNSKNMKIFLITKKDIKNTYNLKFQNLRRINYYTFNRLSES